MQMAPQNDWHHFRKLDTTFGVHSVATAATDKLVYSTIIPKEAVIKLTSPIEFWFVCHFAAHLEQWQFIYDAMSSHFSEITWNVIVLRVKFLEKTQFLMFSTFRGIRLNLCAHMFYMKINFDKHNNTSELVIVVVVVSLVLSVTC